MREGRYRGLLIADFNAQNFARYLDHDPAEPAVEVTAAPIGQVVPLLIDRNSGYWDPRPDLTVIWTQPEAVIDCFKRLLNHQKASLDEVLAEVDEYAARLLDVRNRARHVFVPTWVLPPDRRDFGIYDWTSEAGATLTLARMNLRLAECLTSQPNLHVLNAQQWVGIAGKNAFSSQLWYLAKIPFGNEVFVEAAQDVKAALMGLAGQTKKIIVLDLDNTIWGGVVGEVGWENLRLGGHDHMGEAYVDFQMALKGLTHRGVLLGIVSKNDEATALEAIKKHPAMILRIEDFAGWEVSWEDKAQSIVKLLERLNLGLESAVFIDDHPAERARVREALPQVLVPEWPAEATFFKRALLGLRCFYTASLNKEDLERAQMYDREKQRSELKRSVGSLDDWLHTLQLRVTIEHLAGPNLARTTQLLNKTNQMNLSTRRMTQGELMRWASEPEHALWTFSVSDRFGDSGLTGIASIEVTGERGRIVDFIVSCRVMGRKVEEAMLYIVIQHARSLGLAEVYAEYLPTARNGPCLAFFKQSGYRYDSATSTFVWPMHETYELPRHISLVASSADSAISLGYA